MVQRIEGYYLMLTTETGSAAVGLTVPVGQKYPPGTHVFTTISLSELIKDGQPQDVFFIGFANVDGYTYYLPDGSESPFQYTNSNLAFIKNCASITFSLVAGGLLRARAVASVFIQ